MRRGEIAIGVVVVIALGLLVLVILGMLLTQTFVRADKATSSCQDTYKGTCMASRDCAARDGTIVPDISCSAQSTQQQGDSWSITTFPHGGGVCCVT